jgi:hypothetical protein
VAGWPWVGGGPWPAWRRCFTEARRPASLARDVPGLLGYRHFLAALAPLLGIGGPDDDLERRVVAGRDELTAADPAGYLRRLLDDAGVAALLVDTGFGEEILAVAALEGAAGRPVHPIVRLETVAEQVLGAGGPAAGSLARFTDAVEERLAEALDGGAVAIKSVAAYRGGLRLADPGPAERRRAFGGLDRAGQAARFDDPVLEPFLVRRAAELAAARQVPLQFTPASATRTSTCPWPTRPCCARCCAAHAPATARSCCCTATRSSARPPTWPAPTRRSGWTCH